LRTRTLLLLAIGCGLAILIAGGVQLLRVGGQKESSQLLDVGQPGKAGDVTVTLLAPAESPAGSNDLSVRVRVGGTDDPNGFAGFTLVGPGKVATVKSSTCSGISVADAECTLTFATDGMQGTSRQMIFRRADRQLRWVLNAG
jgi:hypothetical protein